MNEKSRFQISLRRLMIGIAMFFVLFGANVAVIRVGIESYWPDGEGFLALGILFLLFSFGLPTGYILGGWRHIGIRSALIAILVGLAAFLAMYIYAMTNIMV